MDSRTLGFVAAGAVFLLDRVTKIAIRQRVSFDETHVVIPGFFNIVHTENRGAAFGMLAGAPEPVRLAVLVGLSMAVLILLAGMMWRLPAHGRAPVPWLGLALVLGGALGNLYDRVLRGAVTDFLQFFIGPYEWPSFNAADSAITVGAGLLLLEMWRARQPAGEAAGRR